MKMRGIDGIMREILKYCLMKFQNIVPIKVFNTIFRDLIIYQK